MKKQLLSFYKVLLSALLLTLFLSACTTNKAVQSASKKASLRPTADQNKNLYQSPCLLIALQNNNAAMLLGYGNGKSVYEAKQQALYDIANQIEVNVQGESTRNVNKINNKVNSQFSQKVKTRSHALLSSVDVACSDINDPSGQYHFTLRYDKRDLVDVLVDKLTDTLWQGRPATINWQGPSVIVKSDFIKQITSKLVDKKSSQQLTIQIKLFRKDHQWYLTLNNVVTPIKSKHFTQVLNWDSFTTSNIQVGLVNEFGKDIALHMQEGDEFRFIINSKQKGYLSVFDIYEDGRVIKVRDNMPINKKLVLPEHQGSFSAGLLVAKQSTRDNYVFLVTKEKIDSKAFRQLMIEENSTKEQKNYILNLFLFWLDRQTVISASSLQIETVPR